MLTSASERETTQTAGQGPELWAELNKTKTTQTAGQGPELWAELNKTRWWDRDSQDVGLEAAIHSKSA